MAQREPALVTPFWVRIATETSLSPGWLLIAFPAVLYPTYLALEVLFGRGLAAAVDFGGDYEARLPPLFITLLGYVAMMTTYVAAQLNAAGKAFSAVFGTGYMASVLVGAFIVLVYTISGGFRAVAWTDLVQGFLMVTALVVLPVIVITKLGGFGPMFARLAELEQQIEGAVLHQVKQAKYARFTTPLVNLLMLLLGLPFILDRLPGNILADAGRCLAICGICFLLAFVTQSMGVTGRLSALPAWMPVIVFTPVAAVLLDRIRT